MTTDFTICYISRQRNIERDNFENVYAYSLQSELVTLLKFYLNHLGIFIRRIEPVEKRCYGDNKKSAIYYIRLKSEKH